MSSSSFEDVGDSEKYDKFSSNKGKIL